MSEDDQAFKQVKKAAKEAFRELANDPEFSFKVTIEEKAEKKEVTHETEKPKARITCEQCGDEHEASDECPECGQAR